ncbi:hypothetical protein BDV95DRAFT_606502 [Massariosphaeria phaeospora]|uniref:Uncharacterized protein n=1 Tax=Massariosphaeria phaeospora TaxID=100035 RepID=A0A7C8IB81_9PLEO|nr:hypothetical protein BDV95DRAFT_606502 [Massariosphaeria phaeospora]
MAMTPSTLLELQSLLPDPCLGHLQPSDYTNRSTAVAPSKPKPTKQSRTVETWTWSPDGGGVLTGSKEVLRSDSLNHNCSGKSKPLSKPLSKPKPGRRFQTQWQHKPTYEVAAASKLEPLARKAAKSKPEPPARNAAHSKPTASASKGKAPTTAMLPDIGDLRCYRPSFGNASVDPIEYGSIGSRDMGLCKATFQSQIHFRFGANCEFRHRWFSDVELNILEQSPQGRLFVEAAQDAWGSNGPVVTNTKW